MSADILFSTKITARTRAKVAATAKTIHTPSRMFRMILQAAKLNNNPAMDSKANTINVKISPDNSKRRIANKVAMVSSWGDTVNSNLNSLRNARHSHIQATAME